MATVGALGLVATAIVGADPVSAATAGSTPTSGTLYFTCFASQGKVTSSCQTSNDVQKAVYSYDGNQLVVGSPQPVANTQGADGIQFLPNGNLVVAGQQSGTVSEINPSTGIPVQPAVSAGVSSADHISVSPANLYPTQLVTVGGYGGGGMAVLPLDASGNITAGVTCRLTLDGTSVQGAAAQSFVMDTVVWVGTQAYYTESTNTSDPFNGFGAFGTMNITYTPAAGSTSASCSASLTQLLPAIGSTGFPAAHGMTYDSYSKSLILFGSTMIAQIPVSASATLTPTTATPVSEITFDGLACTESTSCYQVPSNLGTNYRFDQGTADGLGHLFVSDNNGNLVFVDYSQTPGLIAGTSSAPSYVSDKFLTSSLDDVANFPLEVNTQAQPNGPAGLGQPLGDSAQVINAPGGGKISFQLFAPNQNNSCSGTSLLAANTQNYAVGTTVTSPLWFPGGGEVTGTYEWLATYTNSTTTPNITQNSVCGSEPVVVAAPSLTITKTADATSVDAGGTIGFTITLTNSGVVPAQVTSLTDNLPGGPAISWTVASQSAYGSCGISGTPQVLDCGRFGLPVGAIETVHVTSATTAASCGTYPNTASFSALPGLLEEAGNIAAGTQQSSGLSGSASASEAVTCPSSPPGPPTLNTPTVTTIPSAGGPVGTALSDTAHVTGITSPLTTDNVNFALYSDSSCSTLVDNLGKVSVIGPTTTNGVATWTASSPGTGFSPTVAGTYYWGVTFNASNDPANLSSSMLCGEPVTITPASGTLGAHTTPTPTPAGAVKAASTPAPNTGAALFLPGLLAALALLFGGLLLMTGVRIRRNPGL